MNEHLHSRHYVGAALVLLVTFSFAQTTIATGSIVGTVTDPSGAVVPAANLTIVNRLTGDTHLVNTTSAGTYASGALIPGPYILRVAAKGFRSTEWPINVQVGVTSPGSVRLQVGRADESVIVKASEVQVNTEQATLQGVLNSEQIASLPVNGRNFLDLAQFEPGVQIQDGVNFDPSKVGYSSISFGGRFGRAARIEVDGLDISDESVGTTTQNIPASAIQEFQLSQSMLDLTTELTSSGAVNVVTRSGANSFHGEGFGLFRDSRTSAELPHPAGLPSPFQRLQFGGRFGGPIVRNRLFFFIDAERTKQELRAPVALAAPFSQYSGTFSAPFRETTTIERADYQFQHGAHLFYRFSFFQNRTLATTKPASYQRYANKNYARQHAVGLDFTTGNFTHAIRAGYLKFQNEIADATRGGGLPFSDLPVSLNIGPISTGPNFIAPQQTVQSNYQAKYDGAKATGAHILRYGFSFNRVHEAAFASFFAFAPGLTSDLSEFETDFANNSCGPGTPCFAGGQTNPLNYPVEFVQMGNGQGFFSEQPAFGLPAGGFGPDYRIGAYIADTWQVKPTLTLTAGVRYVRDTGRTNSDLPPIPELNALGLGRLGGRVRQPNMNFAPQFGFAWDPFHNGRTSIRGGIGLFYENVIWNSTGGDRSLRLKAGAFLQTPVACGGPGVPLPIAVSGGSITAGANSCGTGPDSRGGPIAIGVAAQNLANLQALYQNLSPFDLQAPNPNYVGTLLAEGFSTPPFLFAPGYKTPRSVQINIGIQREIRRGMLFSADVMRNVTTHYLLGLDANHVGDARYFDKNAAIAAIAATNTQFGCPPGINGIDCTIQAGANVHDYAGNGMTSGFDFGGVCTRVAGVSCAFPGINPNVPSVLLAYSSGRSVYNALHLKLLQNVENPTAGVRHLDLQVSYSLSRFVNAGGLAPFTPGASDQDSVEPAVDARNPLRFIGPSLLDRTHQLSFGATIQLAGGIQFSFISHFYSPLPLSLVVPAFVGFGGGPGSIFRNDFTGDGSNPDLVPGTALGAFMRDVGPGGLNELITNYNNTVANQPTRAGQVLIDNNLFTLEQLQAIGAVAPHLTLAPEGQVGTDWLRAFDFKLAWSRKLNEGFRLEPSIAIYNLFNFANFDLPPGTMTGRLSGQPGCLCANHTTYQERISNRVGMGTGVFALGAPRVFEFGLRVEF